MPKQQGSPSPEKHCATTLWYQDSRSRESTHSSVTLIGCQDRCAILSRPFGWVGGGFPQLSKANTLTLLSCGSYFFFPRALHVMLHLGQMFKSVCLFIPLGSQQLFICPSSTCSSMQQLWDAVDDRELTPFCRAISIPANQDTKGRHPTPLRQAIYRLLYLKP